MAKFIPVDPFDIVIFGGTGDLTRRKLLPALFHRYLDGQIDSSCKIIGVARSDLSRQDFRDLAQKACAENACKERALNWSDEKWKGFEALLDYVQMDVLKDDANWAGLKSHLNKDERTRIFYLATTPLIYVATCEALGAEGLNGPNARLVLEKPIGTDLESAQAINRGVGAIFDETAVYRIDHLSLIHI